MGMARKNISGVASVEFVIVLPLLLLFLAAVGEFGNAFIRYNTLSKAVQNGARFAVTEVYGTANSYQIADAQQIRNVVIYGNNLGVGEPLFENMTVDVTYNPDDDTDKYVVVTANYPYTPLLDALLGNVMTDVTLRSSSLMRVRP